MASTHYMDLLMQDSPWNLLIFMAVPVVLAESIAISELYLLWAGGASHPILDKFRRICGILGGLAFIGIIIYFIPTVIMPLSKQHGWRTWIDMVAIYSYLASGVPMILIAMLNFGWLAGGAPAHKRQLWHIVFLSFFLVLSHIAMIFGMVDPSIAGWTQPAHEMHSVDDMSGMNGMDHHEGMHHGMQNMGKQGGMQHN